MSVAVSMGQSERVAVYEVPDNEMAAGSTLGGPKAVCIIKASGALKKVYSSDLGKQIFGTVCLRHFDNRTGMHLAAQGTGKFLLHPEHQEHHFTLAGNIAVTEDIFVLSGEPLENGKVDPPGVYLVIELRNNDTESVEIATFGFADIASNKVSNIDCTWDSRLCAIIASNDQKSDQTRIFGTSTKPKGYQVTNDVAMAVSMTSPGELSGRVEPAHQSMAVLKHVHHLLPGQSVKWFYLLSFGDNQDQAKQNYCECPDAGEALDRTRTYYHKVLSRAVVLTPNPIVNSGVLWAKANMLRVQSLTPTGWAFVNDPTRSVNSVSRDTSWFAFGADYICPAFARSSLMAYVRNQEKDGLVVEYYDTITGKTEDYGLNINDNTPLLILAIWHHYNTSGSKQFLQETYPSAVKAARYILSQRNNKGLVWCSARGTSNKGIVGWRNVISDYSLSGATTEINSECYAALKTVSDMAAVLNETEDSEEFSKEADSLKLAINTYLVNPVNGLYYLNIDLDGVPRSDVTSDLVFPVMFGVADSARSAHIIRRLSDSDFWTAAGIRTVSRDAHDYDPDGTNAGPYGLLGGVWVGVSFWFAFAAAAYSPEFMDHALSASFRNYAMDPRRYNTVPGQFSEWLHGETLANQGMMLSPWLPPRYLWAAIEGAGGLHFSAESLSLTPRLASNWKWLGVRNVPYHNRNLTWLAVRTPSIDVYCNFEYAGSDIHSVFDEDITDHMRAKGDAVCVMGLRKKHNILLFAGNISLETVTTSLCVDFDDLAPTYNLRRYDSLVGNWENAGTVDADGLQHGQVIQLEHQGFCLLEFSIVA